MSILGGATRPSSSGSVVPRVGDEAPIALAFQQERLWFFERTEPGTAAYNLPAAVRMRGTLDESILEHALGQFVDAHEALRMGVRDDGGIPVMFVVPPEPMVLERVDLRVLPDAERERSATMWLETYAGQPFDLTRPPLIRFALLRLGPDESMLAMVMHHMSWDGWCFDLFLEEMKELYEAGLARRTPEISRPAIRYRDYAAWQREYLAGGAGEAHLPYWRRALADGVPDMDVPSDRPRPPVVTHDGARVEFALECDTLESLRELAVAHRATTQMTLLAAFMALVARYTGQDTVVVATPVQGRVNAELDRVVGFFVNPLVLRVPFEVDLTFRELLGRVRDISIGALEHRHVPFELLVREFGRRDLSRTPLYQVMFAHQDVRSRAKQWGPLAVDIAAIDAHVVHTDLSLWVREHARSLDGGLDYRTDLWDRTSMELFLRHFTRLLEAAVATPDVPIARLPILDVAEQRRFVAGRDAHMAGAVPLLLEMVAKQVEENPGAPAGQDRSRTLDYAGLWTESARVAAGLRGAGVGRGALVAVLMRRRVDVLPVLLGVLRAGAAYQPVDPDLPIERVEFMLRDSGARMVVSDPELRHLVPSGIPAMAASELRAADSTDVELDPCGAGDLAYVLYTSGSTGKPKGVEITHGALANVLWSMKREPGLDRSDVWMAVTTLSFDIAGLELFLPLCVGARVIVADESTVADGRALAATLTDSGATVMQGTPATWRLLLDGGWSGHLRLALCGGETLPRELARALLPRAEQLWNVYGPTETTIWSTIDRVRDEDGPVPIGAPIDNTRIYIVDRAGQLVPATAAGEIWIGGAGVARGYHDRPEQTAERFTENPFLPGERVYRTGDLGRWRRDGRLEHLGRLDFQVKVNGLRIELGEIEATLETLPEITQAVVVAHGAQEDKRLVAYVTLSPGSAPTKTEIRRALGRTLPAYMVPGLVVPLDALPLTPNGKVDRKALPDPLANVPTRIEYVAPRTASEKLIAATWTRLLNAGRVGVHDNFFELGGHSLLAIQAVAILADQGGLDIDPRTLFFQTLEQVAAGATAVRAGAEA